MLRPRSATRRPDARAPPRRACETRATWLENVVRMIRPRAPGERRAQPVARPRARRASGPAARRWSSRRARGRRPSPDRRGDALAVGRLAVGRIVVELEVAGVEEPPAARLDEDRGGVGHRVRDAEERDGERAGADRLAGRAPRSSRSSGRLRLLEPPPRERQREREAVDRARRTTRAGTAARRCGPRGRASGRRRRSARRAATERSGAMRSMPGKRLVGKRDADVHEDARAAARAARGRCVPNSPTPPSGTISSGAVTRAAAIARERQEVLERQLLGARHAASCPSASSAAPSRARGARGGQRVGERLAARVEPERGEAQRARATQRPARAASSRGVSSRTLEMTFGRGRKAPGGRSKRMRPRRERRGAHGEVSVALRRPAGPRSAARPRAGRSRRSGGSSRGSSMRRGEDRRRRRCTAGSRRGRAGPVAARPPSSHSANGRSSTSPRKIATRASPRELLGRAPRPAADRSRRRRRAAARARERPRQRAVARARPRGRCRRAPTRAASTMRSAVSGLRQKVLAPALAGGNAGLPRAGPPVMLWRHGVA